MIEFSETDVEYLQGGIRQRVNPKKASRLFSKTTPFNVRHLSRADPVT